MPCRLGIIGGGNMGGAIVRGAIGAGVLAPQEILVVEVDERKRGMFADLNCRTVPDAAAALECEQIILAIKPQTFPEVAAVIAPLPSSMVVITIMAGRGSTSVCAALGGNARVVRAMPNLPCQIGEGMTAIALGEGASPGDETLAQSLFESIGRCITVDESLMHAVTAVSGSGPAYVLLLAESMEQAAVKLGLTTHEARAIVSQTILGAATLLDRSPQTADELRQSVTSPGGTTAAAMEVMFERELPEIITEALTAARDRGRELDLTP
jgi:pyrroline-5-carboxylate reductase